MLYFFEDESALVVTQSETFSSLSNEARDVLVFLFVVFFLEVLVE